MQNFDVVFFENENDAEETVFDTLRRPETSAVVIRGLLDESAQQRAVLNINEIPLSRWDSPNQGMPGGEVLTIGSAATPTFRSFQGPSLADYVDSVREDLPLLTQVFEACDLSGTLAACFSRVMKVSQAEPAPLKNGGHSLPYNLRSLQTGQQIYAHHDQHYRLPIFEHFAETVNRNHLYSWFVQLSCADAGGELIIYNIAGDDPNLPYLPTRFVDSAALDESCERCVVPLQPGDLVVFNSGRYVHRVTAVEDSTPRLTVGGFLTTSTAAQPDLFHWS